MDGGEAGMHVGLELDLTRARARYASGVEAHSCSISKTDLAQESYPHLDLYLCQSTDFFIKTMCSPCQIFYICFVLLQRQI